MKIFRQALACFLLAAFAGCATIANYDQYAYRRSVELKVETVHLMGKAVEEYPSRQADAERLQLELETAYEYEKGRPKNEVTAEMWRKMASPDENLAGGFLKLWREKVRLAPAFVAEMQRTVAEAFDQIIGLESGKIRK